MPAEQLCSMVPEGTHAQHKANLKKTHSKVYLQSPFVWYNLSVAALPFIPYVCDPDSVYKAVGFCSTQIHFLQQAHLA